MAYNLVPELQYWFNKFIMETKLNKEITPTPVSIPLIYLHRESFIEVLFNDNYSKPLYKYMYREGSSCSPIPNIVKTRISIYPNKKYYTISDSTNSETNINLFNLTTEELLIIDRLLQYRLDPKNTIISDLPFNRSAYETNIISDGTTFIDYDTLDSTSSELYSVDSTSTILYDLIYLYLDLKINNNIESYNNVALLTLNHTGATPKQVLECCFEKYLIEKMFLYVSSLNVI